VSARIEPCVRRRTGLYTLPLSFSRVFPPAKDGTMMAVSWELPPTRTWTRPERCCRFPNRFRNGTDSVELRKVGISEATSGVSGTVTRFGPLALIVGEPSSHYVESKATLTDVVRDRQLDRETEKCSVVPNRQVGYIAAHKLDCESGIDRKICGRYRGDKGTWVIGG
jgi:hypothetical protein